MRGRYLSEVRGGSRDDKQVPDMVGYQKLDMAGAFDPASADLAGTDANAPDDLPFTAANGCAVQVDTAFRETCTAMTIPVEVTQQQPEEFDCQLVGPNIVLLPEEIEVRTLASFLSIMNTVEDADVYVTGIGGDTETALTMGEVLRQKKATATLVGTARSAHSIIWAMAPVRKMFYYAGIRIHQSAVYPNGSLSMKDVRNIGDVMDQTNERMLQIYVKASNKGDEWWREKLVPSFDPMFELPAAMLLEIGMGEYAYE